MFFTNPESTNFMFHFLKGCKVFRNPKISHLELKTTIKIVGQILKFASKRPNVLIIKIKSEFKNQIVSKFDLGLLKCIQTDVF